MDSHFHYCFKDVTFKGKTKCLKHKRARCFSYSLPVTTSTWICPKMIMCGSSHIRHPVQPKNSHICPNFATFFILHVLPRAELEVKWCTLRPGGKAHIFWWNNLLAAVKQTLKNAFVFYIILINILGLFSRTILAYWITCQMTAIEEMYVERGKKRLKGEAVV